MVRKRPNRTSLRTTVQQGYGEQCWYGQDCWYGQRCWYDHTADAGRTEFDGRVEHLTQEDGQIGELKKEDFQLRVGAEEVAEKFKAVFMESFCNVRQPSLERRIEELEELLAEKSCDLERLREDYEQLLHDKCGLEREFDALLEKATKVEDELSSMRKQLNSVSNEQASSSLCRGTAIERLAADWQYESAPGDWTGLPADRGKKLHEGFEKFLNGGAKLLRMKSGVEAYDFDFALMTQKNIRTLKERPIRCSFPTPRHWTSRVDLDHVYQFTSSTAVTISGFKDDELDGIYVKSDHDKIDGHNLWWSLCGSSIAYMTKGGSIHIVGIIGVWEDAGRKSDLLSRVRSRADIWDAKFQFGPDLLQATGSWVVLSEFNGPPDFVHVQVSPCLLNPSVPFMSIAVEVEVGKLYKLLEDALRETCVHGADFHGDSPSPCDHFSNEFVLARVLRIENWQLFSRYSSHLQDMKVGLLKYKIKLESVDPRLSGALTSLANGYAAGLDEGVNECLLFHGTSFEFASKIAVEGFDFRLSEAGYYGHGTYFASQACKSHQYTMGDLKTMIVSRVAIGDLCYAKKVDTECRRPPIRVGTHRCYDTVVAKPGPMQGHDKLVQTHQEFIIFEKFQAYPEFIVQYYLRSGT